MKNYIIKDEWNIIEEGFDPSVNKISESIFSIGNGRMGQRANFEEQYSGESLRGSYVAGVYYPDKTRVGWWKNGYPAHFAKVVNSVNWIGIDIQLNQEVLDINKMETAAFRRILNMKEGVLQREFIATLQQGEQIQIRSTRFCSIVDNEIGAICYEIRPLNGDVNVRINNYLDGDVWNADANYDEQFWQEVRKENSPMASQLTMETKRTSFWLSASMSYDLLVDGKKVAIVDTGVERDRYIGKECVLEVTKGQSLIIYKYVAILSSTNHDKSTINEKSLTVLKKAVEKGFDQLKAEQAAAWAAKWEESDIVIEGDIAAQQAIRFNIFQLYQTYTGEDARLNIGPKGFTGEKYGGVTYWDTEAYCLPFYLATANEEVGRNLLIYRYKHLGKAYENAQMLGFGAGAALYPMVTVDGTECHNEWEITFEELHRNGAIAFAIFNYIRYTGHEDYLVSHGLDVLIGIARFWSQRVNWSEEKKKFVLLGVTGPNEYENNVNNNWYTNTIAVWCLNYTLYAINYVKQVDTSIWKDICERLQFDEGECVRWKAIINQMFYPEDKVRGIFLQQEGYLDKEQMLVRDLPLSERPINQKWSWDRILRSCFIKQADVLQGIYFFEDRFDIDTVRRNYEYYEARTVHESSLSPCLHAILAAKLKDEKKAYAFYLQTARLDLDDYNNDTEDGLHITSMAGTWMSIVEGFAGMRIREGKLHFTPFIPSAWSGYKFNIKFRGHQLGIKVEKEKITINNRSSKDIALIVHDLSLYIPSNGQKVLTYKQEHRTI